MSVILALEPSVMAPAEARRLVSAELRPLPALLRTDAALLVSELVSERVEAAAEQIRVQVERKGRGARIGVQSRGPSPDVVGWSEFAPGLLDRLSDGWGVEQAANGWLAWFELAPGPAALAGRTDEELFAALPTSRAARQALFERHQGLAGHLARRFAGRGEATDDLEQVGAIGLVKAIERFDPEMGVKFATFASKTIVGEIKRYFRDYSWSVRVPRGLKERSLELIRAGDELSQRLGRMPTVTELGEDLGLQPEEVAESLQAGMAHGSLSIDASAEEEVASLTEVLATLDPEMKLAEEWRQLAPAVAELAERERRILYMRFFRDLSQSEIAAELGISQMHVSRLLARAFQRLRTLLD